MTDKEKIIEQIDKIERYSHQPGNEWLLAELKRRFGNSYTWDSSTVSDDVAFIRSALSIKANNSITYDFITNQRLKDQLIIDNLRMENAAFNLQEKEIDRFYTFCVNAFYQVENMVNYYFFVSYPNIQDLLTAIEKYTQNDGEGGIYRFRRSQTNQESNVGDIPISFKINALCNILFPRDNIIKITLGNLRKVRNEGEHRCQIIYSQKDESNKLYLFLKRATFNSIRILLIKVVSAIKEQLSKTTKVETVYGTIVSKLPGACFISFNGERHQLPANMMKKISNLKDGDNILVKLRDKTIVDVTLVQQ